jgi:hypothetical protein
LKAVNRLFLIAIVIGFYSTAFVVFRVLVTRSAENQPVRVRRPCLPVGEDTAVIVALGQSNAGNWGMGRYAATEAVDNFDPETGNCFSAIDRLLGTDGNGSSFLPRLGDLLIQSGKFHRVIVVSIAVGGASIFNLASIHLGRIDNLIKKLRQAGITPTHFLFQQGETDAMLNTTEAEYLASLVRLVRQFRSAGYEAPFYVALSTKCGEGHPRNRRAIRAAQAAAIDINLNIRRGPDTDIIGNSGRAPGYCHMNETGTIAQAALWVAFIRRTVSTETDHTAEALRPKIRTGNIQQ